MQHTRLLHIVLPLIEVCRRYFGWPIAAYIGIIFLVPMVLSGLLMDLLFRALGLVPTSTTAFAPKSLISA